MDITITEGFLLLWALFATFAAAVFQHQIYIAKRFTFHLIDDPQLYADLRRSIQSAKEKHNGSRL